jgi:hypothetical protein
MVTVFFPFIIIIIIIIIIIHSVHSINEHSGVPRLTLRGSGVHCRIAPVKALTCHKSTAR